MYGIMRVEKRGRNAVYGLQIEANRTPKDHYEDGRDFPNSDIDWTRTKDNISLIKTEHWNKGINVLLDEHKLKARKDSVVLLDTMYTASPAFFVDKSKEEIISYFEQCLAYHRETYGDYIINAVVHFDQTSPHMHLVSVPIVQDKEGKYHLSAKIIMGNRGDYRKRQDSFYEKICKQYGFERGEKNPEVSKKHVTEREYRIQQQKEILEQQAEKLAEQQKQETEHKLALDRVKSSQAILDNAGNVPFSDKKVISKKELFALAERAGFADMIRAKEGDLAEKERILQDKEKELKEKEEHLERERVRVWKTKNGSLYGEEREKLTELEEKTKEWTLYNWRERTEGERLKREIETLEQERKNLLKSVNRLKEQKEEITKMKTYCLLNQCDYDDWQRNKGRWKSQEYGLER